MNTFSIELGKKDAERFIADEQIDYKPFVAMSDLYMVRKTVPLNYNTMEQTVRELDAELWVKLDEAAVGLAQEHGKRFEFDSYALGFTEGVAAVWEKIRDEVLK